MADVLGDREAVVCRELTKLYETFYRGPLAELAADPALVAPKGEIVETAREARQGYLDRPVLVVLGVSTALALAVLGGLWIFGT